jgi:signal peptidase I
VAGVRFSRATILFASLALAGLLTPAAALDETRDPWIRGTFTGNSPRAAALPESTAWREAQTVIARTPGAFILIGTGRSMEPLYPAGTLLVLRETDYAALRSGQTVVYRSEAGRAVGHVLVAKARDGWRAKGLNNRTHDLEPVVAGNVIGVVVAAYRPVSDPGQPVARARRAAGRAVFQSAGGR